MKKLIVLQKIEIELRKAWGEPDMVMTQMDAHVRAQKIEALEKQKQQIQKDDEKFRRSQNKAD